MTLNPASGALLTFTLTAGGKGQHTFQCSKCDVPDPLKSDKAMGIDIESSNGDQLPILGSFASALPCPPSGPLSTIAAS